MIELSNFTCVFLEVRPFCGTRVPVKLQVKYQGHIFQKSFNIGCNFGILSDIAFIFYMCISRG